MGNQKDKVVFCPSCRNYVTDFRCSPSEVKCGYCGFVFNVFTDDYKGVQEYIFQKTTSWKPNDTMIKRRDK